MTFWSSGDKNGNEDGDNNNEEEDDGDGNDDDMSLKQYVILQADWEENRTSWLDGVCTCSATSL